MRCRSLLLLFSFGFVVLYILNSIFSSLSSISLYSCKIPFEGKDPNVFGYLCAVDRCVHDFFQETEYSKFETMWRKLPDSLNWCATNAQMSVTKFTSKKEVLMFKVKNMMEKKKMEAGEGCTAVVISFDDDSSLKDLELEKILKTCTIHYVEFSSSRIHGLAKVLKSYNPIIDLLIVGPSKASSHLLFQQFLGDYYDYLPTVCQVNFAHTLPRAREENGFQESIQRLRSEKKFLLMGASKDRTDMHLNLFFENMDQKYCRERYFRVIYGIQKKSNKMNEMKEAELKTQECLQKYIDLKQRFMGANLNQNFTLIQNEQQLEIVLKSYTTDQLNQQISMLLSLERSLIACEEKALLNRQLNGPLTPASSNNPKKIEHSGSSKDKVNKNEKKRQKLLKKCLRSYYIYDHRCKRLKPFLDPAFSRRSTLSQIEDKLYNADIEEIKAFKKRVDTSNFGLWQLEQLHFPHVMFFYSDDDCFTKPFKQLWKLAKRIFCCVKSEDN